MDNFCFRFLYISLTISLSAQSISVHAKYHTQLIHDLQQALQIVSNPTSYLIYSSSPLFNEPLQLSQTSSMCGRFALGVDANELGAHLARQYFRNPPPENPDQPSPSTSNQNSSEQPEASGSGSGAGEGFVSSGSPSLVQQIAQQGQDSDDEGEGAQGGEKEVRWSSMEAKSSWRPRYNVAPKSGGVVLRKNHKEKGVYELDVLKWGLV